MPADVVRFAERALSGRPRRTLLALLGVAIGVLAVVLLTSVGEGARLFVVRQFAELGTNLVIVLPGRTETTGVAPFTGGAVHDLTLDDVEALAHSLPALDRLAPLALGNETVSSGDRARQVIVLGSTAELLRVRDLEIAGGSFLPPGAMDRGSSVVVLGSKVASELFAGESPLGRVVRIGDWRLRVIGVLAPRGMHMGLDMNEIVVVPVATCMRMFDQTSLFRILLKVRSHESIDPTRERVLGILEDRHGEKDVTVWTQDAVIGALSSILGALTIAAGAIAAISLLVAGVGIMNVMLVAVSERRREIGLMKALGARSSQVRLLFLAEALLLSACGAALGLLAGWVGVRVLVALVPAFPATPPAWAMLVTMATSILAGALFGSLPAHRAMRLDPLEALSRR